MIKKSKNLVVAVVMSITSIFAITSCSDGGILPNINVFSTDKDVELGQQIDQEIVNNSTQYPILNDAEATSYVQNMINQIIQSPEIQFRDKFTYKVRLLNTDDLNAFCTPGGYIYVYKGILKFFDNEATLAAVLAHEIAHAERRHATKRMTQQLGINVLLQFLLGNSPSTLETIAANLFSGMALLKNSRADETESDRYSFKYLQSTVWYPGAGKLFFEKINNHQEEPAYKEFFSTHPSDANRIAAIEKLIQEANLAAPSESNLFAQRYNLFKSKLN